ncbi:CRAL-TRIO domain-containing protein T23G5.2 [Orchesella cincta]|uniref:CRAL-TRIO domain-containing protein T23G5.2 n=1 Tax=Orchesella cincta TaxID=48709 RepID=A0A1D2NHC1_ORCCI|nr:CRAL-TRIO domain-containing protein T23G5.2 [Orchesella cincta]
MIIDEVQENKCLDELRKLVKDLEQSDAALKRCLRARNYDVNKAEDMVRKTVEWRKTNKVDEALTWKIDDFIIQQFPIEYTGVDFNNRAVAFVPVGSWPVREMLENGHREQMLMYIYVCLEKLIEQIEKTGDQFTLIIDLEGMTYWKVAHYETIQMTLKVFRDFEANYPERLGEALVINAPLVLNYVWPTYQATIDRLDVEKGSVFGIQLCQVYSSDPDSHEYRIPF